MMSDNQQERSELENLLGEVEARIEAGDSSSDLQWMASRIGEMSSLRLRVGMRLYGFCGGFFGRDSYAEKTVIAFGTDWIVVRNMQTGRPEFGTLEEDSYFSPASGWRRLLEASEEGREENVGY